MVKKSICFYSYSNCPFLINYYETIFLKEALLKHIISFFSKRLFSIVLVLVFAITTFSGCGKDETFAEFTHSLFLDEITSNTINLHYCLENPSEYGIRTYAISLGDYSKEARTAAAENLEDTLISLATYPYLTLTTEEKLTFHILEDYLSTQLSLSKYELYQEPLSASGGIHMELPILFAEYEFNTEQDVKDYLELISLTDEYYDQILDFEREKADAGLFMSDTLCQKVIDSCESFLENRENHYLSSTFESRLTELGLSEKEQTSYIEKNNAILQEQLFPAYESLITNLSDLYGSGINELGLCYFEKGAEYYELLVYAETGCDDSIDEIFRNIELQRMEDLIACADIKASDSTIVEQCTFLEWEMTDPQTMVSSLQNEILDDFPTPPEASYVINYVEPALEEYLAPAFYIVSPLDNYLENTIYINNTYVTNDLYGFTTLAHEGYPGHLYQTIMSYEYELPEIRTVLNYPGYTEGWATYIEMMSYSYAGLDENVASMLSRNQAATLSLYASSDIGLHYYGWTKEDMYAFWKGYGISNTDVIDKITQLILSEPGNYLKYYVGYLEFLDLQDTVKISLGDDFSLVEFHRTILDIGPAPFSIIEKFFWEYYSPQT